jgi:hypothetical protein
MIYAPELTAKIFAAINSVMLSNNGYAEIGNDSAVAEAMSLAGFVVIHTKSLFGRPTYKAFTKEAQVALATDGVPHYKTVRNDTGPDYEGMILARQERAMMDY